MRFRLVLSGIAFYLWALAFVFLSSFMIAPFFLFFDHSTIMKPKLWEAVLYVLGVCGSLATATYLLWKIDECLKKVLG